MLQNSAYCFPNTSVCPSGYPHVAITEPTILGCHTVLTGKIVTVVSKDHSAFIL